MIINKHPPDGQEEFILTNEMISRTNRNIAQAKLRMHCPHCGEEFKYNVMYCVYCRSRFRWRAYFQNGSLNILYDYMIDDIKPERKFPIVRIIALISIFLILTLGIGSLHFILNKPENAADLILPDYGFTNAPTTYYYTGRVRNGVPHGKGALHYTDYVRDVNPMNENEALSDWYEVTITYSGRFRNGQLNGRGIATIDGYKWYEGQFKDGLRDGKGTVYTGDINEEITRTGTFKNGRSHGLITMYSASGTVMGVYRFEDGTAVEKISD
jgi:hypothetical protein